MKDETEEVRSTLRNFCKLRPTFGCCAELASTFAL
jgi:hypothetical protein